MRCVVLTFFHGLGHLTRSCRVAAELADRGHEVVVGCAPAAMEIVRSAGLAGAPLRELPPLSAAAMAALTAAPPGHRPPRSRLAAPEYLRDCLADEQALIERHRPDVVLVDFRMTGAVSATLAGVPSAWLVNTNFFVHPFPDVWPDVRRSLIELGTPTEAVEHALGDAVLVPDLALFEPIRSLPETALTYLTGLAREIRHVGPVPGTPTNRVPDRATARASWRAGDRPLLYVTMGGTAQGLPSLRTIVRQLERLDVDAVVVSGPHIDPGDVGPVPDNVRLIGFTDDAASLIRAADLVVCHGGHTTLTEAVCLGTPALCVPQQPEQRQNAQRLEQLGVGRVVLPDDLAGHFRPVVGELLGDVHQRARAADVAALLSRHDGAAAAADHLELIASLHGLGRPWG